MTAKPYTIEEYVRWSEVDPAGILCYSAYFRFFEMAETELFRAAGLAFGDAFDRFDVWFPRAAVHSEFYRPARLDDRLRVAAYVSRVGTTSMTLNFEVLQGDPPALSAAGYEVIVCVDRSALRPRALPPPVVAALAPYTLTLDAARAVLGVAGP